MEKISELDNAESDIGVDRFNFRQKGTFLAIEN